MIAPGSDGCFDRHNRDAGSRVRSPTLPVEFQCHLEFAGGVAQARNLAKFSTVNYCVGSAEMRVIERVESLQTVFQSHPLAEPVQGDFFEKREVK